MHVISNQLIMFDKPAPNSFQSFNCSHSSSTIYILIDLEILNTQSIVTMRY